MRTFCQPISAARKDAPEEREKPLSPLSEEHSPQPKRPTQQSSDGASTPTPRRPHAGTTDEGTPKSDSKKKSKSEQLAERHPKKSKRAKGPPGNAPSRQNSSLSLLSSKLSGPGAWESAKQAPMHGKIVLFVRSSPLSLLLQAHLVSRKLTRAASTDALLALRDRRATTRNEQGDQKRKPRAASSRELVQGLGSDSCVSRGSPSTASATDARSVLLSWHRYVSP